MATNIKVTVIGFVVWFVVLLFIRLLGASVFSAGNLWFVVFYLACFPVGVLFTWTMQKLINVPMQEMLQPIAILVIVAVMMDGFSFGFTKFYGVGDHELYSAAFLLWAPGVFLLCALWLISRAKQSQEKASRLTPS